MKKWKIYQEKKIDLTNYLVQLSSKIFKAESGDLYQLNFEQKNFELAIKNVKGLELINIKGINVYDILRKEKLVLTKSSVEMLSERLQ